MSNENGFSEEGDTGTICNNVGSILWGAAAFVGAIGVAAGIVYGAVSYFSSDKTGLEQPASAVENSGLVEKVQGGQNEK